MADRPERASYRIVYPLTARPVFRMETLEVSVVDLSATGFRILLPRDWMPRIGDTIVGELRLVSGSSAAVGGRLLRVVVPHAAGLFLWGFTFARVMEEERWLARHFLTRSNY